MGKKKKVKKCGMDSLLFVAGCAVGAGAIQGTKYLKKWKHQNDPVNESGENPDTNQSTKEKSEE